LKFNNDKGANKVKDRLKQLIRTVEREEWGGTYELVSVFCLFFA